MDIIDKAITKIVNSINKDRQDQLSIANAPDGQVQAWMNEQRKLGYKRSGKAGWVKIATIPMVVDQWFTKMYGADYFKDPDFFDKMYPEWKVVKNTKTI